MAQPEGLLFFHSRLLSISRSFPLVQSHHMRRERRPQLKEEEDQSESACNDSSLALKRDSQFPDGLGIRSSLIDHTDTHSRQSFPGGSPAHSSYE